MDKKKICIGVIVVFILVFITCLIIVLNNNTNSIANNSNTKLATRTTVSKNTVLKNIINETQLPRIEENTNEIKLQSNTVDIDTIIVNEQENKINIEEQQVSTEKDAISNKPKETISINENDSKYISTIKNIEETITIDKEINKEENKTNNNPQENLNLSKDRQENTKTENTQEQSEQETTNKDNTSIINSGIQENILKNESQEEKNKKLAKENLLKSIIYPTEYLYTKNGDNELKFNKTEALKVASAIIDESFNYNELWDGNKFLYKIEFKYIESIMQDSMYWPYRETAIVSAARNANRNKIFYIWAEDYIYKGEKVHTQYCIR